MVVCHTLGVFGDLQSVASVLVIYEATVLLTKTDVSTFKFDSGNPHTCHTPAIHKKHIQSVEVVLMRCIKTHLQNDDTKFEIRLSEVFHAFFLKPVCSSLISTVLKLEEIEVIWERYFITQKNITFLEGNTIKELCCNFHVYDADKDHCLSLDRFSDLDKSFFKTKPPESSFSFQENVTKFGPLFMMLIETINQLNCSIKKFLQKTLFVVTDKMVPLC